MYDTKSILFCKNQWILKLAPLSRIRDLTLKVEDTQCDPRILLTKWPLHFASSIGVSSSEAPKRKLSNVCSETITFAKISQMYQTKSLLFYDNPWILKLVPLSRICDLTLSLILGEDSFYLELIWLQTLPKTPLICHEIAPRGSRDRFRWP